MLAAADFCAIAAVTDDAVLRQCLQCSPDIASGRIPLTVIRDATSMARAYNAGLDQTSAPICLLVHQDVYLPKGWLDRAIEVLDELATTHGDWLVAGPHGVDPDRRQAGRVFDVAMGLELGNRDFDPIPVAALDELLLILRRTERFRFDEELPGFHLYGTDLVQTAWATGHSAWAVELPVVHNNRPVGSLSGGYDRAYCYLRRKWRDRLPIQTTICLLSHNPLPLWREKWRARRFRERPVHAPLPSPEVARKAGYE